MSDRLFANPSTQQASTQHSSTHPSSTHPSSTHPSSTQTSSTQTSTAWLRYFQTNRDRPLPLPWDCAYQLTDSEKATIAHSIQNFQLGESSEGSHLMKVSRNYGDRVGDPRWVEVVKLFIGEEQRHARDLGRFMKQQQIPLAQRHWSDSLFRKLRRLSNLEVAVAVLFTAEVIATVYYQALGQATRSPLLQQLCQQIVHDETQHVCFQAETLGKIRRRYPRWQIGLADALYYLFFRSTLIAVWLDHRPVLRASGYRFWEFNHAACSALSLAYQTMKGIDATETAITETALLD